VGRTCAPVPLALGVIDGIHVVQRNPRRRYAGMAFARRFVDASVGGFPLVLGDMGQRYGKIQPICAPVFRNPPLHARPNV